MDNNELIIPDLTNEELKEIARCKNFTSRSWEHINKFPERYRFQLNKEELNSVMSKKLTSPTNFFSGQNCGTRKLPYAFTEQGIYMLMTVLKGDLATNV